MPLNSTLKMVNFVLCVFPQKHFLRALLFSVYKVSWACGMSLKYYLSQECSSSPVEVFVCVCVCVCVCVFKYLFSVSNGMSRTQGFFIPSLFVLVFVFDIETVSQTPGNTQLSFHI